jgi:hypothetical protein
MSEVLCSDRWAGTTETTALLNVGSLTIIGATY